MGKPEKSSREARGGAPQNRGAPERACEGADAGVHEGKQHEKHLREYSQEHPDFGEHPREHSRELFWGLSISGQFEARNFPNLNLISLGNVNGVLQTGFLKYRNPSPSQHFTNPTPTPSPTLPQPLPNSSSQPPPKPNFKDPV